jgi:hypothetical protein
MNKIEYTGVTLNYDQVSVPMNIDKSQTLAQMLRNLNQFRVNPFKEVIGKNGETLNLNLTLSQIKKPRDLTLK